ncbi:C2 calcium-dependent membrane targeting [Cinnamomum micranthum f. kanehirae]|uniref:C2 calcium-dependent membrane targeting n=1 Tax=Cinnamomum micranthum f. kanehirae TaxID=337451 RepID=A0A3S3NST3_9MAGN|nr:C2 calcium-dependent membrane targeting [Cinnamomum micranthum f. kanehirae]
MNEEIRIPKTRVFLSLSAAITFGFFSQTALEEVQSVGGNCQFVRERMSNRQSEFPKPSPGNLRRLKELLDKSDNHTCADCGAPDPKWAPWTDGIYSGLWDFHPDTPTFPRFSGRWITEPLVSHK